MQQNLIEDVGVRSLKYLYDFGDCWEHTVRVERVTDPLPGIVYPRLVEAVGRCPPEDVGGPPGYEEFLAAIADPSHERHAEFVEWLGGPFDPAAVDADRHAQALASLAKRWSRAPATRKRST